MLAEQAIFSSESGPSKQGYRLVSHSPGVSRSQINSLTQWGPSHGALVSNELDFASLNFHPLDDTHFAISRTVYGGPEYSQRGSFQIFTRSILVKNTLLEDYDDNPLWLLNQCNILGNLRFDRHVVGRDSLPALELPECSYIGRPNVSEPERSTREKVANCVQMLQLGRNVALVGESVNLNVFSYLISLLASDIRSQLSFTTGLRPSVRRPFHLHLFSKLTPDLKTQFKKLGINEVCLA